ncbi:hypothetical protein OAO87_03770 [bacterium]|nr:hypothetical protein [bacterium]
MHVHALVRPAAARSGGWRLRLPAIRLGRGVDDEVQQLAFVRDGAAVQREQQRVYTLSPLHVESASSPRAQMARRPPSRRRPRCRLRGAARDGGATALCMPRCCRSTCTGSASGSGWASAIETRRASTMGNGEKEWSCDGARDVPL